MTGRKLTKNVTVKIVCILALTFVVACSDSVRLQPLPSDAVILAFGDSLTAGVGSSSGYDYPSILAELTGLKVINVGISGETAAEGRVRFEDELETHKPDIVVLIEGGNDILRNRNHQAIKKDLASMLDIASKRSVPVILYGVPEKSLFSSSAPFYEELAQEFDVVFNPKLIAKLLKDPQMKSDPIHFNNRGYRRLAQSVLESLQKSGAL